MDNKDLIGLFNTMKADESLPAYERDAKLDAVAEKLINSTIDCYNNTVAQYDNLRSELSDFDKILWSIFLDEINNNFACIKNLKILDIGASVGRDIIYGEKLGADMYGVELSDGFLAYLDKLYTDQTIKNKVKKCDMRELSCPDSFFDVVRHSATLLHLPVIGKGYTTDKALAETNRVLKEGGLVYIVVKEGEPRLKIHNTGEGLGERIFQFFTMDLLCEVAERNGFKVVMKQKLEETRPNEIIPTLVLIGRKIR